MMRKFDALDYFQGQDLLLALVVAVSEMLQRNNLSLQDFDFYELHKAFTGQVLAPLKSWESDKFEKENLGRSTALGSIDRLKLNTRE